VVTELPTTEYLGETFIVDFRLGEIRNSKTAQPIRFTELKEDVNSDVKKELRGIRSRTYYNEYIRGIDD
jgi:hypothetical protein